MNELRELVSRESTHGVLTICFEVDLGDRKAPWRTWLKDQLRELEREAHEGDDRERWLAFKATAERVIDRYHPEHAPPEGRTQLGFVEVAQKPAWERWQHFQLPPPPPVAVHADHPFLAPVAELLDIGRGAGVAVISAERVHLFDHNMGTLEELARWELETFELAWRERKAPRMSDPARGHATSSSGHDQHHQRLEENRSRFLKQVGQLADQALAEREREELICFGDPVLCERMTNGLRNRSLVHSEDTDLISAPDHEIAERVAALLPALRESRQHELVSSVVDAANSGGNGSLGTRETAQALIEGRVDHLLVAAEAEIEAPPEPKELAAAANGLVREWMIERAVLTSAAITPLRGGPQDEIGEYGGAAALLRY